MKVTKFPTLDEALALHEALLERFGGQAGVRDMGLLESALVRPQSGYYETITMQAAALLQSLAMNHVFVDGNKRMAFALTAIFLDMNGLSLTVGARAGETFLLKKVIAEHASIDVIAAWLAKHVE